MVFAGTSIRPQCASVAAEWLFLIFEVLAGGEADRTVEAAGNGETVVIGLADVFLRSPILLHDVVLLTSPVVSRLCVVIDCL